MAALAYVQSLLRDSRSTRYNRERTVNLVNRRKFD